MADAERAEADVAAGERKKPTVHKTPAWAGEDTPGEVL